MSTLLDDIAAATKGKSFKTYKYGFDGIDVPRFDYDDHRHQITWKSYGETAYLPKPKNMKPMADAYLEGPSLFPYFLDGSRKAYKVDDMAYRNQVYPIFRMYLDGMGSVRIMKTLIAEGIPAPEGGLWNASVIMMMLRNEKYAGDLLLQKFFTNNHIEKKQFFNRGELPQYFVAGDHEPIIDRETFEAVQAEIARRKEIYTANGGRKAAEEAEDYLLELEEKKLSDLPLGDHIHCGICGKKYRRKITRLGTPYAAPIWICGTFSYRGKAYCASKQIPEKILLDMIANVLGISPILDDQEALDSIHHIEMHPNNRVLFVFQDGHTEEHFWKDHSRKDSWDAEKRKKAAEKTKEQRKRRKEQTAQ